MSALEDRNRTTHDSEAGRDRIVEAISFAAQRFLAAEWRDAMPDVLQRLGEAIDVSRSYLFYNTPLADGTPAASMPFEWTAPGIPGTMDDPEFQDGPWVESGYGRWMKLLSLGRPVAGPTREMEPEERPQLERVGTKSVCAVPVFVDGSWWGHLGFDDCVRERVWSPAEIDALRAAAGILGAAIENERRDDRLRRAEARYRLLVERSPSVIYQARAEPGGETQMIYVGPQIEHFTGHPAERWLDETFWDRQIHPDDLEAVLAEDERTTETGELYSIDYRIRRSDGRWMWVHDEAALVSDAGTEPFWQGFILDISRRKRAEAEREAAQEQYQALVETIPAITYIDLDPTGRSGHFVSPQIEEILGYTQQEWLSADEFWHSHLHPDDRDELVAAWEKALAANEPFDAEYRMLRADGSIAWISERTVVLPATEQHPHQVQGVMFDVTRAKEAEEGLLRAEARYRKLIEGMPVATYVENMDKDPEGFYMSPQIEKITGWPPSSFHDRTFWSSRLHPDDRERVMAVDVQADSTRTPFSAEYRFLRPDGTSVWLLDEATMQPDPRGGESWHGVIIDITARKVAEERVEQALEVEREAAQELRELDDAKNTFLEAVAHDLRTPLSAILGLAVTLENPDINLEEGETHQLAARIAVNARKLDGLVRDMLDLDRLTKGIVEPKLEPTALHKLIREVVDHSDITSQRQVVVDSHPVQLAVDPARVERIVDNLLTNAVRHTPPEAHVWVRLRAHRQGAIIMVEDDGPGVPDELRNKIFEAFQRGPNAPEYSPGVGIGLSLVQRFAAMHGGRAWVQHREGGGASFRVFLPSPAHRGKDPEKLELEVRLAD